MKIQNFLNKLLMKMELYLVVNAIELRHMEEIYGLRQDAERGDAEAQYELGLCYSCGDEDAMEQDFTKAMYWYSKAAEQGHPEAQDNLGVCYEDGNGVEKDRDIAMEWFSKAAKQGLAKGRKNLRRNRKISR